MYPGCPFEREVLGLEMVQLVLSELMPVEGSQSALAKVRVCVSGMEIYHAYGGRYSRFAWRSGRFVEATTSVCFVRSSGAFRH